MSITNRFEKRKIKDQFEKELIQLHYRQSELQKKLRELPYVELDVPIHRGYVRYFELREDVAKSNKGEFYESLLSKINTKMFSHDIKFLKKGRKKNKKKTYNEREQHLKKLSQSDWEGKKLILSESERSCFDCKLVYNQWKRVYEKEYVFRESWRFVLKIAPHMITKMRIHDPLLLSEISELDRHIEANNLLGKMCKAMSKSYNRYRIWDKQKKEKEKLDWLKEYNIEVENNQIETHLKDDIS
jgi:hypothetical protein